MAGPRNLRASFILEVMGRGFERLTQLQSRLERIRGLAQRMAGVGLIGSALTFAGPVQAVAAYEDALRQSAITQGMVGAEATRQVAVISREYEQLARATGQRSQAIAEAAADLVAANLPRNVIQEMMPLLARTATATGASLSDLSKLAISLNQNLRIGPEGMTQAFAAMAQAGMEGRFELRDMASEFPRLTAQAEGLGLTGQRAVTSLSSMLQVARRGAATSSEAANNLGNFLAKITSPEVVENFKKMGVDLPRLLADAARRGINPVEAVIQRIRTLTRGDMFRVGNLFGDMQVLNFLRPMMNNVGEYRRILQAASAANAGLLDQGFQTRWEGFRIQIERASEGADQFGRRLGAAVMPQIRMLNDAMDWLHDRMEEVEAAHPGLIDGVLGWGAALIVGAGALGTVALAVVPVIKGIGMVGAVLKVLLLPFSWIMRVLMGFGLAASAAAVVAAALATALVAAGLHIWRNWERFRGFFQQLWAGVRDIFGGFAQWVAGWFTGTQANRVAAVQRMWSGLGSFFGGLWGIVKTLFTDFVAWVDGWTGGAVTGAATGFQNLWTGLVAWAGNDLWPGVQAAFTDFASWVMAWIGGAVASAAEAFRGVWGFLSVWGSTLWGVVQGAFSAFASWVDGWTGGAVTAAVNAFKAAWAALPDFFRGLFRAIGDAFGAIWAPIQAAIDAARRAMPSTEAEARANGQAGETSRTTDTEGQPVPADERRRVNASPGAVMARQAVTVGGRIVVEAGPNTRVREVESRTPGVDLAPASAGPMLARP